MVGVPGTEERLALTEVEDRLRQLRGRFNLYSLQHNVYLFGTALALGAAVLIIAAFKLSSSFFAWIAWPLSLLLLGFLAYSVYRLQGEWANLVHTARRADQRMGLQERVSTLAAQLENGAIRKTPPSRLWPHLVADNTARLSDWEIKKVAPHRIPWSILPFLAAVLITGLIASNALLSPAAQDDPFTLDNMQRVAQDLPQRVNTLIDEKTSLLPPASENSGDSVALNQSGSQHAADANRTNQQSQNGQQNQPNLQINPTDGEAHISSDNSATQTLASLPKEVQESIRRALKGLQIAPNPQTQQSHSGSSDASAASSQLNQSNQSNQLALNPGQANNPHRQPDFSVETKDLPSGEQTQSGQSGQANNSKSGLGGQAGQAPAQGSGLQQLSQARLGRKNTRGSFKPKAPQMPGQNAGGLRGAGTGAGSGTDPNVLGQRANLGTNENTFQLSLDSTYELNRRGEGEPVMYEGELPPSKSRRNLSQQQSLDDTIRKAKIPPEYEAIVKRLFSRGESR